MDARHFFTGSIRSWTAYLAMCFEAVGMIMLRKVTSNAGMEVMVVASSVDDPELVPKL